MKTAGLLRQVTLSERILNRVEDALWMRDTDESPAMACQRLGVKPDALEASIRHAGESWPALARYAHEVSRLKKRKVKEYR